MGSIIRVGGEEALSKFLKHEDVRSDIEKYHFIVISDHVKIRELDKKGSPKNAKLTYFKGLVPNPGVVAIRVNGGTKEYKNAYLDQLQTDLMDSVVSIIVKSAIPNDLNIVLVCSETEDKDWGYLKLLCKYIEIAYKAKTYSYKKYLKDVKKASKVENIDEITAIVTKKLSKYADQFDFNVEIGMNGVPKDKVKKKYSEMSRKKLIKIAKKKDIKVSKDDPREKIVKKLVKASA